MHKVDCRELRNKVEQWRLCMVLPRNMVKSRTDIKGKEEVILEKISLWMSTYLS